MKLLRWDDLDDAGRRDALARPAARTDVRVVEGVRAILDEVAAEGWPAVARHALRLDGAPPTLVRVAPAAAEARTTLPADAVAAMELAHANLTAVHENQRPAPTRTEPVPGLVVETAWRPLDRVGLYVPGGATPLFSTLLHLAVPARAAGVTDLVVCTPPRADGELDPAIALAADLCGLDAVWTLGGAQAIAAMALGAGPIAPVAKVCGPGNAWVAEAKRQAAACPGGPALDMPAGPSELMVIADRDADPVAVAADLLGQAEHDAHAQVLLVTPSAPLAEAAVAEVARQAASLPRDAQLASSVAAARAILVRDLATAAAVANAYAPEHLHLAVADFEALVPAITNAGAVFAGHSVAETFGDYLTGSSHVLPTDGAARAWSGVGVHTFLRAMSVQRMTPQAAARLAAPAAALARLEGLEAHARAAERRGA